MIGRMALRYLEGRGFSLEAIMHYALGYSVAGNTLGRIIIPVDEAYWQARTVFSIGTKYINPSTAKQDSLFNADALRLHKVRIAEGAFSAMSLGKNAIAILGKKPTRQQLDRLRLASTQVYHVHLDADATDLAYVLAEQLHRAGKNVTVMEYKKGDPADGKRGPKVTIGFATLMRHKLEHAE
jgi:DNA primase